MPRFYRLLADFITGCNVGQDSSLTTAPVIAILSIGFIIESYWGKKLSPETKDNMNRHFHTMFMKPCKHACFLLLMLFLSSCGQVPPPATETSTIPPFAWTAIALTQTAMPTKTSLPTGTPTFVTVTPSPLPTQPPVILITPDAIQVERWQEYQTELAKLVLSEAGDIYPYYEIAICEWDILGRSGQEVYVWATCFAPSAGDTKPAVIHLAIDGSIQKVEVPFHGAAWNKSIQKLFPADMQEAIDLYSSSARVEELNLHIQYRLTYPEELPLIVLSVNSNP